jgi:histone deacetylase complex regulatory component SIN3
MEPQGAPTEASEVQDAAAASSQQASAVATAASANPYRTLNVKDALGYLDSVKLKFKYEVSTYTPQAKSFLTQVAARSEPEVYNDFL